MVDDFNLTVVDGTSPVQKQQKNVRQIVRKILQGWEGLDQPMVAPRRRRKSAQVEASKEEVAQ